MTLRVVLANLPDLLRDIVSESLRTGDAPVDIEVVVVDGSEAVVAAALGPANSDTGSDADAAIVRVDDEAASAAAGRLAQGRLHTLVLGISTDGRRTFVFELRPHAIPLGQLSPAELRATVCARVTEGPR